MRYHYNDGGRALAGFRGEANDCVTRAVAIAMQIEYADVYKIMALGNASQKSIRLSTRRSSLGKRTARERIDTRSKWFREFMARRGWTWTPTMQIGSGCKVHLVEHELPPGRLIVAVSKHYVAVIDGEIHDVFDPSRDGSRCVYGYWRKA